MNYTVDLSDDAEEDLKGLAPNTKREVNQALKRLRLGPDPRRGDLQLTDADDRWRALAGRRWRIVFAVLPGRRIEVQRIRTRPLAYRGIEHPHQRELQEDATPYPVIPGSDVGNRTGQAEDEDEPITGEKRSAPAIVPCITHPPPFTRPSPA